MGIDKLFIAIKEYIKLHGKHDSGNFPIIQVKREILSALEEIIDARIKHYAAREKRIDTIKNIKQPDYTLDDNTISLIDALNNAPTPPSDAERFLNQPTAAKFWIETYSDWFYNKRKEAIKKV